MIVVFRRKKGIGKRKVNIRRRRGGALSDYLPSVDTVASYIPYGKSALETYRTGKEAYHTVKKVHGIYKDIVGPTTSTPAKPPPLPKGGPPPLSKRDLEHNRRLREGPGADISTDPTSYIQTLRKIAPISFIDKTLSALGQRERVRGYLSKSPLGRALVTGADLAIKSGFGYRRLMRRKKKRVHRVLLRRRKGGYYIVDQKVIPGNTQIFTY